MPIVAVLSGKGGAGKTTVATSLFLSIPDASLLDGDVEEPNSSLFLEWDYAPTESEFTVPRPVINTDLCTHCGACARFCHFNALLSGASLTIPLPELCHGCGGCERLCPTGALSYRRRPAGRLLQGTVQGKALVFGETAVGETSAVPLLRYLFEVQPRRASEGILLVDGPPGAACAASTVTDRADYVILVGESSAFGFSDFLRTESMVRDMDVPYGVVVNKSGWGDDSLESHCRSHGITILADIPFSRPRAEAYARGRLLFDHHDRTLFAELSVRLRREILALETA